jgi:hypothetical protein
MINTVDDDRLTEIQEALQSGDLAKGLAAMYSLRAEEIMSMVAELIRSREKPLHCPGCDGDHL